MGDRFSFLPDKRIETLQQFYDSMAVSAQIRREAIGNYLKNNSSNPDLKETLVSLKNLLHQIPGSPDNATVSLDKEQTISLRLDYELGELDRDIRFLMDGEQRFRQWLLHTQPQFERELEEAKALLGKTEFRTIFSDRDGTINNYCGRYLSSIQSFYNGVYVSRFASNSVENAVILTSAPLSNGGLIDMSVVPENLFILAGSKGREYSAPGGKMGAYPISQKQQQSILELNTALEELFQEPRNRKFGLIGSGYQRKFGQTTVARQDIDKSIDATESDRWLNTVRDLVRKTDPAGSTFRIEDTGLDIEILLTVKEDADASAGLRDFDKGDGIRFLGTELSLSIETGPNLVCGDTSSDVPMLISCTDLCPSSTYGIFVTTDEKLKAKVRDANANTVIVSSPDVLVAALTSSSENKFS